MMGDVLLQGNSPTVALPSLQMFLCEGSVVRSHSSLPLRGLEGVPGLPGPPQDEAGLTRSLQRSLCRAGWAQRLHPKRVPVSTAAGGLSLQWVITLGPHRKPRITVPSP